MALTRWYFPGVPSPTQRRFWCARCLTDWQGVSAEVGTCLVCAATVTIPTDKV